MTLDKIISQLPPSLSVLSEELTTLYVSKECLLHAHYLQHIPSEIDNIQSQFIQLCVNNKLLPIEFLEKKVHRQGIVGRYLDSGGEISRAWYRFMCIDEKYREWQQPYFAINYEKHEKDAICINKLSPKVIQYLRDKNIDLLLN